MIPKLIKYTKLFATYVIATLVCVVGLKIAYADQDQFDLLSENTFQKVSYLELVNSPKKYDGKMVSFRSMVLFTLDYAGLYSEDNQTHIPICLGSDNLTYFVNSVPKGVVDQGNHSVIASGIFRIEPPSSDPVILISGCSSPFRLENASINKIMNG